jgi:8-oxo-dGTP pyrophosphatase MutT (NUDIX family)
MTPPDPEFSAGGVVVRDGAADTECIVIVPTRRAADGSKVLALPKGHPDPGETAREAAVREVREEAGVDVDVLDHLGDVRYWYQRQGRRIAKRVQFFLMRWVGGDVANHDHEVENARWVPLEEAARTLTYAGEREMVQRAMSRTPDR